MSVFVLIRVENALLLAHFDLRVILKSWTSTNSCFLYLYFVLKSVIQAFCIPFNRTNQTPIQFCFPSPVSFAYILLSIPIHLYLPPKIIIRPIEISSHWIYIYCSFSLYTQQIYSNGRRRETTATDSKCKTHL